MHRSYIFLALTIEVWSIQCLLWVFWIKKMTVVKRYPCNILAPVFLITDRKLKLENVFHIFYRQVLILCPAVVNHSHFVTFWRLVSSQHCQSPTHVATAALKTSVRSSFGLYFLWIGKLLCGIISHPLCSRSQPMREDVTYITSSLIGWDIRAGHR